MEGSGRMTILVIKNMNLDRKLLEGKVKRSMMTYKSIKNHIIYKKYFFQPSIFSPRNSGFDEFQIHISRHRSLGNM